MGKRLIQQRRGKGTPRYRAKSHKSKGDIKYPPINRHKENNISGQVIEFIHDSARSAPLAKVLFEDFSEILIIAPQNLRVGSWIEIGDNAKIKEGNILPLEKIPEGTRVYNIEIKPGDGGKLVRSGGSFAQIVSHETKSGLSYLLLPSKKSVSFNSKVRATIGRIAGAGKTEKPFTKAGQAYHKNKAKNKLYPTVSGVSMNPVDHPFGGGSSIGKSTTISRDAPPGRKVGHIAAKRTGRKKR